ncbi:MAG TPA: PrsW family glutamic-type intramembrane protease [Ktedonobacteraceae bacterium]|nr:PrsW family glutamic-type intramembrane protease [Ktedonobacteraceae bacterium]
MSQNYGVLRVMGVHRVHQTGREFIDPQPSAITLMGQEEYQSDWLSEERFVHVISRREMTIGRALDNDIILMDPAVSREHACLVLDNRGWRIYNLTEKNTVLVNGRSVPSGGCLSLLPQDFLQVGNTIMQLVAPQLGMADDMSLSPSVDRLATVFPLPSDHGAATNGHEQHKACTQLQHPPILQYPPTDREERKKPMLLPVPLDMGNSNGTMLNISSGFALGVRMRWITLVVGLVILTLGVVGTFVLNSLGEFAVLVQGGQSSLLVGLTIPLIPAISINLLVNFMDRFKREPWFLRLAAFLWGAIIAIPPAVFVEQFIDGIISNWWGAYPNIALHSFLQGLDAGVTEETVKGLGLLLLFIVLRDEFDNVTDGIVYGALIGAGFAMVENVVNFVNPRDLLGLIVGRIVLGWFCHSTFTVCFGAALGYIRHTRVRWQHIVIPLLGYLLAVGLHTGFDFVNAFVRNFSFTYPNNTTVATLLLIAVVSDYIPPFIAQVVILSVLIKALAHEAAVIREFLASEVSSGIVSVDEYALLQHSFARTKAERQVLRQQGIKQWLRVKTLYQTEIGLAFHKWHVSMGDKQKFGHMQSEDAYRQRIMFLHQQIIAAQKFPISPPRTR